MCDKQYISGGYSIEEAQRSDRHAYGHFTFAFLDNFGRHPYPYSAGRERVIVTHGP